MIRESDILQKNIEEVIEQNGGTYDEALECIVVHLDKEAVLRNLMENTDRSLHSILCEMLRAEEQPEPDNFDVFMDRAKSLLQRWENFRNQHRDREGIAQHCIKGFLTEVNDKFTEMLGN
jgi:hypothetical protein